MPNLCTPATPRVPLEQQVAAVIREIGMRERVYPGWVGKGKMKPEKAEHEIAAMKNVLGTVNDYIDMQPKVLALTACSLALARKLGMPQEEFDKMLVEAEADAKARLAAPQVPA